MASPPAFYSAFLAKKVLKLKLWIEKASYHTIFSRVKMPQNSLCQAMKKW